MAGAAGAERLALGVVHAAPALGGVSPFGVRFTPALVGVGRPGHVALTFDDGPDPASTPEFLDGARRPRLARHVLHARRRWYASRPALAREVADAGHEIAVHGDVHFNMLRRTPRHAFDDIARAARHDRRRHRRHAPVVPSAVRHLVVRRRSARARSLGMTTVLWTTWGRDWRPRGHARAPSSPTSPGRYVDGGTILLHDSDCTSYPGSWHSASARCRGWPTSSPSTASRSAPSASTASPAAPPDARAYDHHVIFIVVKFLVKPEYVDRWLDLVAPFTTATRAEPGNLWFEWSRSVDTPNEFVLIEAFADGDAGRTHVESEHFAGRDRGDARGAARDAADREPARRPTGLERDGRDHRHAVMRYSAPVVQSPTKSAPDSRRPVPAPGFRTR